MAQYYKNEGEQQPEKNHCRDLSDVHQTEHRESKDVHTPKPKRKYHEDYDEDYTPNSRSKRNKHKKRSHSKSRKRSVSKSDKNDCSSDSKRSKTDSKTETCKSDSKSESCKSEIKKTEPRNESKDEIKDLKNELKDLKNQSTNGKEKKRDSTKDSDVSYKVNCKAEKQHVTNSVSSMVTCGTVSVGATSTYSNIGSTLPTQNASSQSPLKKTVPEKLNTTPIKTNLNKVLTPKKTPKKENSKPPVDLLDEIMRGMDGKNWN